MRAVNISWALRKFVKPSWLKGLLKPGRFSRVWEGKCGPACRLRDGLDDLLRALILLVNLEVENSSCVLDVNLKMLNLSQSDNQWNISHSVRPEQPWGSLWAWNSGMMAYSRVWCAALGSFRLVREIIVSASEPEIMTFKWQFAICAVLGHSSTSVALIFCTVCLHARSSLCLHIIFCLDHSLCIPAIFLIICALHLFRCSCQWTAWLFK